MSDGIIGNITIGLPGIVIDYQSLLHLMIFVLITVIIRFLIVWFVSTLMRRGLISAGTKVMMTRILDILVIITIAMVSVHTITASLTPYIIILVIGLLVLVLFYYEIKEFTAFITIQLQKYVRGTWIEVYLPNFSSPIRGRIVDILPFNSILEDVYGNKIYVSNSILINSLIKEYNPSILLEITVTTKEYMNINEILTIIKKVVEGSPFRMDETYTPIKSLGQGSVSLVLKLIPLSTPVRASDLFKVMRQISSALAMYTPIIEVIGE